MKKRLKGSMAAVAAAILSLGAAAGPAAAQNGDAKASGVSGGSGVPGSPTQVENYKPLIIPPGYAVQTIKIPSHITLGVGGMAFTKDGTLLICTREGEVWKYKQDQWSLYAEGLHEALGIYSDHRTGQVFVMQRPEFTELIDSDNDGRVDRFRSIASDWGLTDNYHEYAFGPVRDSKGNFYGTLNTTLSWPGWAGSTKWDIGRVHEGKMGRAARYRGWSFMVTPDGKFTPFSSGMRSPAGLGINREDEIFYTDNQGDWNGSSSLQHVVKGRFHGHPSSLMDHPDFAGKDLNKLTRQQYDAIRTPPAVWFPHEELAKSPGNPEFDYTGGKFGPFAGQVFVGDQTRSNIARVALEKVDGEYQGVAFDFIDHLQSGAIRILFGPDGALWVGQTGRGWGSSGGKQFGLQRITWDGKTAPFEMHSIKITPTGFDIHFTEPVDAQTARKIESYQIDHWHYHYHGEYGSPKVEQKKDAITEVVLSQDRRMAHVSLALQAGKIYRVTAKGVRSAEGTSLTNPTGFYTLNRLKK